MTRAIVPQRRSEGRRGGGLQLQKGGVRIGWWSSGLAMAVLQAVEAAENEHWHGERRRKKTWADRAPERGQDAGQGKGQSVEVKDGEGKD